MYSENIIVNGREYTLQHPGNRAVQQIQNTALKVVDDGVSLNSLPLMDYCFENVVIPVNGSPRLSVDGPIINGKKPTIVSTSKEEFIAWQKEYAEVWVRILPSFLRGNLETYVFTSSNYEGNTSPDIGTENMETFQDEAVPGVAVKTRHRRRAITQGS
jgi:hypothetical protein